MNTQHIRRHRLPLTITLATVVLAMVVWVVVAVQGLVSRLGPVWDGEPYPVADPAATARRLDHDTQVAYEALRLPDARLDPESPGAGMESSGSGCGLRGLRHLVDNISDTPPSEPYVVSVSDHWGLQGVPRERALPALERVRAALTHSGWSVVSFENSRYGLALRLRHPAGGDTIHVESYPGGRLAVYAFSECARYPHRDGADTWDDPPLPEPVAPAQLRKADEYVGPSIPVSQVSPNPDPEMHKGFI
ncbi:hypothetical protein ACFWBX_13440 [Streptomyces sp. NPDC059991]|uniref:hypothetical protein n=1 Tax=Streptomyces sp. NPDC059991 TaxID=3347028 RepID=UPI0036BC0ED8